MSLPLALPLSLAPPQRLPQRLPLALSLPLALPRLLSLSRPPPRRRRRPAVAVAAWSARRCLRDMPPGHHRVQRAPRSPSRRQGCRSGPQGVGRDTVAGRVSAGGVPDRAPCNVVLLDDRALPCVALWNDRARRGLAPREVRRAHCTTRPWEVRRETARSCGTSRGGLAPDRQVSLDDGVVVAQRPGTVGRRPPHLPQRIRRGVHDAKEAGGQSIRVP